MGDMEKQIKIPNSKLLPEKESCDFNVNMCFHLSSISFISHKKFGNRSGMASSLGILFTKLEKFSDEKSVDLEM